MAANPPGPGLWKGLQTATRFQADALGTLRDWQGRFGDIMLLKIGGVRFYWLFHPDLAREVLISKAKKFRRTGRQVEVLREWDGEGLVTSDGDFWVRQRRLVQPAFDHRRFTGYAAQMVQVTSRMMTRWIDGQRRQLEVNSAMTDLTMEIAAETFFGTDLASQTQELSQAVTCLSEYATRELGKPFSLPNWLPLASIRKKLHAINYLNQTLDRLVAERRASQEDRGDLLSMLLQARDHEGDGKGLTDEQVRHQMMTLFLAGHDTTAGTLPWVWYLLAKHPEAEAKVRQELQQVLGDNPASFDSFQKLTYTTMVVKETLRLYPQAYVMFARVAAEDVEVGGYRIPKGSQVYPVPYILHHDARWFADPERFDPERFSEERFSQLPSCAWIPFGAGPRACIGAHFATMEMVLVVATIMQRLKLSIPEGQPDPIPHPTFSLRPKNGLVMNLTAIR